MASVSCMAGLGATPSPASPRPNRGGYPACHRASGRRHRPRPLLPRRAGTRGVITAVRNLRDPRPPRIRCDMSGSLPALTARLAVSRGRAGRSGRREPVSPHAPGLAWRHAMSAAPIAAYDTSGYGRIWAVQLQVINHPKRFRAYRPHRSRMRLMLASLQFAFRKMISVIFLRFRGRINLDEWHVAMVGLLSCAVRGLQLLGCAASGDTGVPSSAGRCAGDRCRR